MSCKFISTKNHQNGPDATQPLSNEQIAFAKVVGRALAEAWLRECRRRAKEATKGSPEKSPPDAGER